jgi:hypothetical protein
MTTPRFVWLIAACWIVVSFAVFLALGATSTRSWLYLMAVALGPPVALVRLWPQMPQQSAADVIHGRGGSA